MKARIASLLSGLLFGVGLGVSGMTLPEKVRGFLDVAGDFDPTLAFVMGGALLVHAPLGRWVRARRAPLFDPEWHVVTRKDVDARLVVGAAIFGVGWGLCGVCPGPAIVDLATFDSSFALFVVALLVGSFLASLTRKSEVTPVVSSTS